MPFICDDEEMLVKEQSRLLALIESGFAAFRILVIGDVMLDRSIWGHVDRISPEAPVPVLRSVRTTSAPGGATIDLIFPAAIGERTKRTQCTAARSAVKRPWPVTRAGSSSRRMARPTHFIPEPAVAPVMAGCVSEPRRLAEKRLANDFGEVGFGNRPRMRDFDGRDNVDGFGDVFLTQP